MAWLHISLALFCALALPSTVHAQSGFPNRSLTLVVPFSAGSVADVVARLIADRMSDSLKQQVLIENRPGAGSIVASRAVATASPDGYTMLWVGNHHAIGKSQFKSLPFDILTDFKPISTVSFFEVLIVTRRDSPLRTIDDLVKTAQANPGKLNAATSPVGSTQNLSAELLKSVAKIDFKIVPFRTTADQITAVLRGDVDFAFDNYTSTEGLIADRQLHVIASTGPRRTSYLPDVPTVIESGLNYEVVTWTGIAVPAATPPDIVDILNKAVNDGVPVIESKGAGKKIGQEMRASRPEAVTQRLVDDIAKWSAVIEAAGIPKQ